MNKPLKQQPRTDWHPADIKAALAKNGYTFARIAREYGCTALNSPNTVLHKPWFRMERIVAGIIGVPAADIWPDRYNAKGAPLRKLSVVQPSIRTKINRIRNSLQSLFALRGETMATLADKTGHDMHSVQKVVKRVRNSIKIQTAIAEYLSGQYDITLTTDDLFGSDPRHNLKQLIKLEIDRTSAQERDQLYRRYLLDNLKLSDAKGLRNV